MAVAAASAQCQHCLRPLEPIRDYELTGGPPRNHLLKRCKDLMDINGGNHDTRLTNYAHSDGLFAAWSRETTTKARPLAGAFCP